MDGTLWGHKPLQRDSKPSLLLSGILSQRRVTDKALSTVPSGQPCSVNRVQHWEAGLPAMEAGPQVTEVRVR